MLTPRRTRIVLYDGLVAVKTSHKAKLTVLHARHLSKLSWLVHGFSTRAGGVSRAYRKGDLNLGFTKQDAAAAVKSNRAKFLQQLGAAERAGSRTREATSLWPMVTLRQIHSDIIHVVQSVPNEPIFGDGILTSTPRLLLAVQTADCFPVILVDVKRRAVGVFHAGWRGTARRIVEKGVGEMLRHFGSRARDLQVMIGPGIRGCCFEVGEEVRTHFESQFEYAAKLFQEVKESDPVREKYPLLFLTARAPGHGELPPKIFLDLAEANRQQLLAAGVPEKNVEVSKLCTKCNNDLLFSYRAEKGRTGRQMAVVGMRR